MRGILAGSQRARASATNPSTGISSARAVGSMPAAASSGSGSAPSVRRLWRSILRRWPNAASVTRSSSAAVARQRRRRAGSARTTDDVTFGGGTKADGCMSNRIFGSRAPAGQHRQPAIGLAAGRGDDALGDLALEHQHQPVVPRRPRLGGQPADQQRGGDVVGQVGDDARGLAVEIRPRIEFERVACDDVEPAGIMRARSRRARRWRARRARPRSTRARLR